VLLQPVTSVVDALVPPLVDAIDIDETLERVDVDELLRRVDVDEVVRRIDVNALLQRVDVDAVLGRVDINTLLQRVDVNALAQRVDVNAIAERINIDALVKQVRLVSVVSQGTKGALGSLLDLIRRQAVGIDVVILELVSRTRGRARPVLTGPPVLVGSAAAPHDTPGTVSGYYAGPFSRLLAFAIDVAVVIATFALGASIFTYVARLLSGHQFARGGVSDPWWIVALAVWFVVYMWVGLALAGRTIGKAIVGLRVMASDGSPLAQRQSFLRVVLIPFNVILFGLGFFVGVVGPGRQALHDRLLGTCVLYDWGDRRAEMPGPLTRYLSAKGAFDVTGSAHSPPLRAGGSATQIS
jgi:uncharacterized RDD family membrane protein YckC